MSLEGKIALITGSSRGIGRGIAERLAAEGASVAITDIDADAARQTASELSEAGFKAAGFHIDVVDPVAVDKALAEIEAKFGGLDILVNNAGISINAFFLDTDLDDWRRVVDVNLTGAFLVGQRAARIMVKKGEGRIINICSLSAQRGGVGRAAYGASKAGLELLTKVMAVELADKGININGIAPGPIDTAMTRRVHTPATREAYIKMIPQHRYGDIAEIAAGAAFLAGPDANYINGHILNIDGGMITAGVMYEFTEGTQRTF